MRFSAPKQALLFNSDSEAWSTGTLHRVWKWGILQKCTSMKRWNLSLNFQPAVEYSEPPGIAKLGCLSHQPPPSTSWFLVAVVCHQLSLSLLLTQHVWLLTPTAEAWRHPSLRQNRFHFYLSQSQAYEEKSIFLPGPLGSLICTKGKPGLSACADWKGARPKADLPLTPHTGQGHPHFPTFSFDGGGAGSHKIVRHVILPRM